MGTTVINVPAPIGGINARDPLALQALTDARDIVNMIPYSGSLKRRRGFDTVSTYYANTSQVFATSESPIGPTSGNSVCVADTAGRIVLYAGVSDTSVFGSYLNTLILSTTVKLTNTIFKGRLFIWDSLSQGVRVSMLDSGAVLATYTSGGPTITDCVASGVYKSRHYLIKKNSCILYYSGIDAISGATTTYDIESLFQRGGIILWCGSWSRDSGAGAQDLFIVVSNQGEVLAFQGDFPGGTWALQGRYFTGKPINWHGIAPVGADLAISTFEGITLTSELIRTRGSETDLSQKNSLTDKIAPLYRDYLKLMSESQLKDVFLTHLLEEGLLFFNVPISDSERILLVFNFETQSWFRFKNWNLKSMTTSNGKAFGVSGDSIKIKKLFNAVDDDGSAIEVEVLQSFSDFGSAGLSKRFTMILPFFQTEVEIVPQIGIDTNYTLQPYAGEVSIFTSGGAFWDEEEWDDPFWISGLTSGDFWIPCEGLGKVGAVKFKGSIAGGDLVYSGSTLMIEVGGPL